MEIKKFFLIIGLFLLITGLFGVISPVKAQTLPVKAQTLEELIGQITELQGQLNKFLEQEPRTWCFSFRNDLKKGNSGLEVRILQDALEEEKFTISAEEKVSYYFGDSTFQAIVGFQEKYRADILSPLGLTSGTGYFGSSTKAKLNQLYGCTLAPQPELGYKCPDVDGDNKVDIADVSTIARNIGACLGNAKYSQAADVDKDGCLTTKDSDFVSKLFGKIASEVEQCKGVIYYSLTLATTGQGVTSPSAGTYNYRQGEKITVTATPASGWGFNYWEGADNNSTNPTTVTMSSNKTVTAFFKEKAAPRPEPQYKCPDVDGDGKITVSDISTVSRIVGICSGNANYNSAADIDWDGCITQTDANFVSKFFGKITSEVEQCGGILKYSLTLANNGQGTISPSAGTYTYNKDSKVTVTATPASGWGFNYWEGADNNSVNPTTVTMSSNKTVTAFFKVKTPPTPVCTDSDGDGYYAFNSSYCTTGNDCNDANATIHPNAVEICNDNIDNDCDGLIDGKDSSCQLEYRCPDVNGSGRVDISDISAITNNIGACLGNAKYSQAADIDKDGCITTKDSDFVSKLFGKIASEIEQCKGVIYYSLTMATTGQGTTSPSAGTYTYRQGEKITATATPASGWGFSYWEGADNNSVNPTTVTMSSNKTVTVFFKEKLAPKPEAQYKCPDVDRDGKVTVSDVSAVSFIVGICTGNTKYNPAADIDWDGCITITDVNFVSKFFGKIASEVEQCGGIVKYSLTLANNGQGTISPSAGTYTYNKDSKVTITATPASGWGFSYWEGADNNSTNPTTVTMSSNKTATVFFKGITESQYKCPDVDGNGKVDIADVLAASSSIGACLGNVKYNQAADVDRDGCITQTDVNFVSKLFGKIASEIEQCKTTSTLQNIESMIASLSNAIYQLAEQIRGLFR